MTHDELCQRAAKWLRRKHYCTVLTTKPCIMTDEQPDVIGWVGRGVSWVIEVKVSRSDFLRDSKKPHRDGAGMGDNRYYLAPVGVINPEELKNGWGLLEWDGSKIVEKVSAVNLNGRQKDSREEICRLVSLIVNSNYGCPQIEVIAVSNENANPKEMI